MAFQVLTAAVFAAQAIGTATSAVLTAAAAAGTAGLAAAASLASIAYTSYATKKAEADARKNAAQAPRDITVRSATEPAKIIYGTARTSGPVVYTNTAPTPGTNDNNTLWTVISLCSHEVEDITDIWLDGDEITASQINWGGTGGVTSGKYGPIGSNEVTNFYKRLGTSTQSHVSELATAFTDWTSSYQGKNVAYIVSAFELGTATGEGVWAQGAPTNIRAVVKGKKVYDPRKDTTNGGSGAHRLADPTTWEWSDNPALCLADYLFDDRLGLGAEGVTYDDIDWALVIAAANVCDATVSIPGSATEKRFTCNGALSTGNTYAENIKAILSSMNGQITWSGGKYRIRACAYEAPVYTFTGDDVVGDVQIQPERTRTQRFNTVRGTFVDPESDYVATEFIPYNDSNLQSGRDAGQKLTKDISLPMTNSEYMAQRIGYKMVALNDQQLRCIVPMNWKALKVGVGDRIQLSIDELSWSNKVFRVEGWTFDPDSGFNLTLQEDSSSAYADPGVSDYSTRTLAGTVVFADQPVPSPSNLSATAEEEAVFLQWSNPGRASGYDEIIVYASATSAWSGASEIARTRGTSYRHELARGTTRYYWIRAVDVDGETSIRNPNSDTSAITATAGQIDFANLGGATKPEDNATYNTGALADLDTVGTNQIDDNAVDITKIADTLQSTNYSAGSAGWKLTTDGTFEAGNGTFRGALTATSLTIDSSATVSGFDISDLENARYVDALYVRGTGNNNIANQVLKIGTTEVYNTGSRGFRLSVIKRADHSVLAYRRGGTSSTTLAENQSYDVYISEAARIDLRDALVELRTNSNGTRASGEYGSDIIVVITSYDAHNLNTTNGALLIAEMKNNGATARIDDSSSSYHRVPYILIGVAGCGEGNGIEVMTGLAATDPYAEYFGTLVDGEIRGVIDSLRDGVIINNGGITLDGGGAIKTIGKDSESDSTNGFFIGYNGTNYTVGIGDSTNKLVWNGSSLTVAGSITATSGSIASGVTLNGTATSDVVTGAAAGATALQNGDDITDGSIGGVTITSTKLYQGTGTFQGSTTGFYLDSAGQFSLKDKFSFDGTELFVDGNIEVSDYVRAGSGANTAIISGRDVDEFAFWAGAGFQSDGGPSGGNAPFRVTRDGKVIMTNFALYSQAGTKLFDSQDGLLALPQTAVAQASGTLVPQVSEEITDTTTFTVTLSSTQTITADFSYPVGALYYSGTSLSDALNNVSSAFAVTLEYSDDSGSTWNTFGSTQNFSRVTSGTPSSSQFFVDNRELTISIIYGAEPTTIFIASLQSDRGAIDEGMALVGSTSQSLAAGTYLIRMAFSATGGSGTGAPATNKVREVRLTTSGAGFTVSNGVVSDGVGTSATTGWVTSNFQGKDSSGNVVIAGNLTVNGTTTTLNTATLDVEDKNITLNYGAGDTSASADGAGITIQDAVDASTDATILWDATNDRFDFSHSIAFDGTATTTNQGRGIFWTGYDKEGVTDYTDAASIRHTTNTGGHTGSVLVISSQNDAADGIAFSTHANSKLKHNNWTIWTAQDFSNNSSNWDAAYTYSQVGHVPLAGGTMTGTLKAPTVGIGSPLTGAFPESTALLDVATTTAQTNFSSNALTYGSDRAQLILDSRHSATKDTVLGYAAPMLDFRANNTSSQWSLAQIIGTVDPENGSNHQGGLVFATSGGGSTDPTGRRNNGAAPTARMLIGAGGNVTILTGDLKFGTSPVTVIDSSRNISNVGTISSTHLVTETSTTKDGEGPYDWVTAGSGARGAALRINDIAGANYIIRTGNYDLTFMKHVDAATDDFANVMRFEASGAASTGANVRVFSDLIVQGSLNLSGYNSSNWDTAYSAVNATNLGDTATGLVSFTSQSDWSKPAGYSSMIRGTSTNTSVVGTPKTASYWYYQVIGKRDGLGGTAALLTNYTGNDLYFGHAATDVAPTWRRLWSDIDFSQPLELSGGTMTGALTTTEVTVTNFVKASDNNLKFSAGGNHILNIDLNGKVYPQTDNHTDLGFSSSAARFRNLYLSGAISSAYFWTTSNVNATTVSGITVGGGRIGFDQAGTRSWTMGAGGGYLNVYSGDGNGDLNLASNIGLRLNGTQVLTSARDLQNLGDIVSSGSKFVGAKMRHHRTDALAGAYNTTERIRRTFLEVSYNSHHWMGVNIFKIRVETTYPIGNEYAEYLLHIGYLDTSGSGSQNGSGTNVNDFVLQRVYSSKVQGNYDHQIVVGTPYDTGFDSSNYDIYAVPIYIENDYYTQHRITVEAPAENFNDVTSFTGQNQYIFHKNPAGTTLSGRVTNPLPVQNAHYGVLYGTTKYDRSTTLTDGTAYYVAPSSTSTSINVAGLIKGTYNAGHTGWNNVVIDAAPAAGGAFIRANRASASSGEVGFAWANGGSNQWINYLATSGTNLQWYAGGAAAVMSLNTSGVLDALGGYQVGGTTLADSSRNLVNVGTISSGAITSSGNLRIGAGTQTANGDANITIREGNAFAGFDFHSTRTAGNIGGLRWFSTSSASVPEAQLLIEVDGTLKFYNGSNGAQNVFTISSTGALSSGAITSTGLTVNAPSVSLANQPNIIASFDGTNTDGYGLISVQHTQNSTANALGAGIEIKTGEGQTGSATQEAYLILRGAGNNDLLHIAPYAHKFYVDYHDNDLSGTSYSDYGTLALTLTDTGTATFSGAVSFLSSIESGTINAPQIYSSSGNGVQLGNFNGSDADQWPHVIWYRDTANGWDEGLIKGSSSRGVFSRAHFGIHMDDARSFAFHSSGWDTEMEICGDGRIYQKGPVFIARTSNWSNATLSVEGAGYFKANDTDSRVLYLRDRSNDNGNILQFQNYAGANIWEVVGRANGSYPFYVYKNTGTGSGYKWGITQSGDHQFFGNITGNANITAYSDARLKTDVETLDGAKVLQMRGVSFKRDGEAGSGVIAQELEQVAPELVMTAEDEMGTKSVAYGNLVGYLIEAVKMQQQQIDRQQAQINELIQAIKEKDNGDH